MVHPLFLPLHCQPAADFKADSDGMPSCAHHLGSSRNASNMHTSWVLFTNIYIYITYYIYRHTWYYIVNILHIIYLPYEYCFCGSGSKQSMLFLTIRASRVLFQSHISPQKKRTSLQMVFSVQNGFPHFLLFSIQRGEKLKFSDPWILTRSPLGRAGGLVNC